VRSTGFTYMGIFVVGVTTLLHHETRTTRRVAAVTQEAAAPAPPPEPAIETTRVLEQLAVRIEAAPAPEPQEDTVTSRSRDSRLSRRRRRNRYPGPIPTPADWAPPEGPVRIALQAGHWKAHEAPRELSGLRDNGTSWRGTAEWEANLAIARRAGAMLEERGYEVDILPAVVPPGYRAHLFVSIHADGSNDPRASGYRVASPRRDATGRAARIARLLERSYGEATGLSRIPSVTRRMRNYYAFNFRRYEHALHPMTIGVILETGFLTSASDRRVIIDEPGRAARGIVDAVLAFPETPPPTALGG
jgi:N-acetylmuramoyl-L-alanine amidase